MINGRRKWPHEMRREELIAEIDCLRWEKALMSTDVDLAKRRLLYYQMVSVLLAGVVVLMGALVLYFGQ